MILFHTLHLNYQNNMAKVVASLGQEYQDHKGQLYVVEEKATRHEENEGTEIDLTENFKQRYVFFIFHKNI